MIIREAMPLLMRGESQRQAGEKAAEWLREVGLDDRKHHRAGELSGGEQQRLPAPASHGRQHHVD